MEKFKEKLASLRQDADLANTRASDAEAELKTLESSLTAKDGELLSLKNKVSLLEAEKIRTESRIVQVTSASPDIEPLNTKIADLERQLDVSDEELKEASEKLRTFDTQSELVARNVCQLEKECSQLEFSYNQTKAKYEKSKFELDQMLKQLDDL